ncbi:MAG: tRNA 2-thiouridine(34) synthase MnmA [Phycisphaerae bacterium]
MSRNGKVIVAMSGGVDSSVAASMLKDQGYDCIGVFLRVGAEPVETHSCDITDGRPARRLKHGCCSATDAIDARSISQRLGMPFYALNFQADFDHIIDYFVDEYAQARTPNPCVMCNIHVKFGRLFKYADAMDAEFVATGHYARVLHDERGAHLTRSANAAKDQTYVLFGIRKENLHRCIFPLGAMTNKADVRGIAESLGLAVHDKPDSQEICFVPNNDYGELVRARRPDAVRAGAVIDADGNEVGKHDGVIHYTIGQRRGLGIAAGKPIYVTKLDILNNTVTVGDREDCLHSGLLATDMNWLEPIPTDRKQVEIKIRHMHQATSGWLEIEEPRDDDAATLMNGTRVRAGFDTPQLSVTPGQAAVFYDNNIVLGGGWIHRSLKQGAEDESNESGSVRPPCRTSSTR